MSPREELDLLDLYVLCYFQFPRGTFYLSKNTIGEERTFCSLVWMGGMTNMIRDNRRRVKFTACWVLRRCTYPRTSFSSFCFSLVVETF